MSIVRIGLAETKHFAQGYDTIFGTRKKRNDKKKGKSQAKAAARKTKKPRKKK